jgi:hypothetical protein
MTIEPHLLTALLTTAAAGLMLLSGVGKHALERKWRRCPTCGRTVTRRCPSCSCL